MKMYKLNPDNIIQDENGNHIAWLEDEFNMELGRNLTNYINKQFPLSPIPDKLRIPFSYYCGNCKEELSDDGYYPSNNYCSNCGQMIMKIESKLPK